MIRLLLADDQALVRGALAALLNLETDFEVVAQVERGDEVLAAVRSSSPDVALLDVDMPGMNGIEVIAELSQLAPTVKSLIVTTFGRPGYLQRAIEAGAHGFVVKDTPPAELAAAIRRVDQGLRVVDPSLAADSIIDGRSPLTERETEVLRVALTGDSATAIAGRLHLSTGTVRNYLSSAAAKTGATNSVQAAIIARDRGWL